MPMLVSLATNDPTTKAMPHVLSGQAFLVGRHADCSMRLDHVSVSRQHAKIHQRDGIWYIEDLHSRNGTYRNGSRIQAGEIGEGDILHIGDYTIIYSERPIESFVTMDSWLQRVRLKAAELSMKIYTANTDIAAAVISPAAAVRPLSTPTTTKGKVVRAKPSDILKNPAYQGTAKLPTVQKAPAQDSVSGLKFIIIPPLPANYQPQTSR